MIYDVIIIGGSFAGLSAAMQLVRAQRKVLVIDANSPRNRFAKASHGVFGLDGKSPAEIRDIGLSQLRAYPTFELWEASVEGLEQCDVGFSVLTHADQEAKGLRVILASGIRDRLPEIEGVDECWGESVVHCPYCHGYELRNQNLGVLATTEMSLHQAAMIPDWGATTFFTQGQFEPEGDMASLLERRGVVIERTPIVRVVHAEKQIQAVVLADGREVPLGGLYVGPQIEMNTPLIERLGLAMQETPMGNVVKVDEMKESSVKGLFVAGDLSNPMQSGTLAVASGMFAGIYAHRSLIF